MLWPMGMWWNLSLMCRGDCENCGNLIPSGNKFCGECGCSVESGSTNIANTGGDIHGSLYQAGRDIVVNSSMSSDPVTANYEAVPKWRSPVTQGILGWTSFLLAVCGFLPLFWKIVLRPLTWIFFQWPAEFSAEQASQNFLLASLLAVVIILIFFLLLLWFVARKQVRKPLWFGWAINGKGRRLTLEKIYPNPCPKCGGKMWYSKDQKWAAFLKCERNSEHLFKMDPAEEIVDESR